MTNLLNLKSMNAAAEIRLMRRKTARAQTPGPAAPKREPAEETSFCHRYRTNKTVAHIWDSFYTNIDFAKLSIISASNATGTKALMRDA